MARTSKTDKGTPNFNSCSKISRGKRSTFSSQKFGVTPKRHFVFVKTFGCQMNVRDSEVICGILQKDGFKITNEPQKADIILFNTCSVRQHAEDKVWSEIGRFKKGQSLRGGVPVIGVVGCMAQNYKERIFERAPGVDFVVGPSDIHKIPDIIENLISSKLQAPSSKLFEKKIYETDGEVRSEEIYHTGFYQDKEHAYVVISEGCSNFCSYCVVPYVRGPLRNRHYKNILREIEEAVDKGITKLTLLGQNVNAYNYDSTNFVKLVRLVELVKGLKEFSFITSHPKDTTLDLFKVMANSSKLKKYLHLPVQSGSDRILKLMNRGYTKKLYLDLIEDYRKIVNKGVLTTDIIVGFPSETEKDFRDTLDLVKDIEFDAAYIFKYSPRPHTEAANLVDDVPREEKQRRHRITLDLQKEISRKCKVQSEKRKVKTQSSKSLVLSFGFALCALSFALPCYALNLDKVKVHFLSADYKSAILEGEKVLADSQPTFNLDELYYILGLSYLKDGNYLRASDIFEIILNEFKDSNFKDDARLSLADTYFLRGDYDKAEQHYKELVNHSPQTKLFSQVYYRLSECAIKRGNPQEAKGYLDKLKNDYPLNLETKANQDLARPELYYTVQVGSFSKSTNANNLMEKLIQKGYPAYIEQLERQDKITYRVRVGKFSSKAEAVALENKLTQEGYPTKIYP